MRAIITGEGGLDGLRMVDRPDPGQPGPGEMRVALHGSSLNYHDYGVASGRMGSPGRVPMADGGGVVEAVGEGVTEFQAGDAVVSCFFPDWLDGAPVVGDFSRTPGDGIDGFAQEAVVLPAHHFTHAPRGWSATEAATITTAGLTAWRALVEDGRIKAGDTVLALGTGGVSIWALQIARMTGARVCVTSSSDEKLERARALGAEHVINYRATKDWGAAAHDWADGGVDHVVEVGGPGTLAQSIEAVRIGGHIHLIGVLTGISGDVPTATLMRKQARLQGLIVGSRRQQQDFVRALDAAPDLRPVIDRTFGLNELADAFRHEESGSHFGKIGVAW
jgi:NADPH:quinone reductase-like Zn-dependent oxidoreductase